MNLSVNHRCRQLIHAPRLDRTLPSLYGSSRRRRLPPPLLLYLNIITRLPPIASFPARTLPPIYLNKRMASTAASYRTNVAQARTLVHKGNLHLSTGSHVLAFPLYLQAAELYSLVVRQAPDPLEKRTVKTEWAEALRLAGLVKRVLKGKVGEGGVRVDLAELRCSQSA